MKTGPKGTQFYQSLLREKFDGKYPGPVRKRNLREENRRKMLRAIYRREHERDKYQKFARWVRSIRASMKKSRKEFASLVGVSEITLRRWEYGLGHLPATWKKKNKHGQEVPSNMERLRKLAALSKDLKRSGTEFE